MDSTIRQKKPLRVTIEFDPSSVLLGFRWERRDYEVSGIRQGDGYLHTIRRRFEVWLCPLPFVVIWVAWDGGTYDDSSECPF